jgi:hypothetical protein
LDTNAREQPAISGSNRRPTVVAWRAERVAWLPDSEGSPRFDVGCVDNVGGRDGVDAIRGSGPAAYFQGQDALPGDSAVSTLYLPLS